MNDNIKENALSDDELATIGGGFERSQMTFEERLRYDQLCDAWKKALKQGRRGPWEPEYIALESYYDSLKRKYDG